MPGETGVIPLGPVAQGGGRRRLRGPVTPWAARATLAGRGREKIVRLAGERMEQAWRDAGLPILPRWFAPVARDQFGRPIEESEEAADRRSGHAAARSPGRQQRPGRAGCQQRREQGLSPEPKRLRLLRESR